VQAAAIRGRHSDGSAIAALVTEHLASMRAVAVCLLGPGADADDVVQDAAVVALTRIDSLRDPTALRPWLLGIVRNLCRQSLARRRGDIEDGALERLRDWQFDPGEVLARQVDNDLVWAAVNGLSEPLRHVIVLRYLTRASSYEAIAAVLDLPVGTVRSRLNQARGLLTRRLELLAESVIPDRAEHVRRRVHLVTGIYHEYNAGHDCDLLRSALASDANLRVGGAAHVDQGREAIAGWLESDDVRVPARLLDIVVGTDITVAEISFANPEKHPEHCPPISTHVYLHDGDGVRALHLHYSQAG
jgi:RNA polymerase sigma-70 factor (ECF subfamily)